MTRTCPGWLIAGFVALLVAPSFACFVQGKCHSDEDCVGHETCDPLSGSCRLQCERDADCFVNGQFMGKECFDHRCQWRLDERVRAPGFCLEVVNPASSRHGEELCLSDLRGKAVLIYFAYLA